MPGSHDWRNRAASQISQQLPDDGADLLAVLDPRAVDRHIWPKAEYERATQLTAIGDTVNTASRLESACKELGVQAVISKSVLAAAGLEPDGAYEEKSIDVRGRTQPLEIYAIRRATQLPSAGQSAAPNL